MARYAMIVDLQYCTGCHACEIACNQEYDRPLGMSGLKVVESTMAQGEGYRINFMPVRTDLCTFCVKRLREGRPAACAQSCMADCLRVAELDNIMTEIEGGGQRKAVFF